MTNIKLATLDSNGKLSSTLLPDGGSSTTVNSLLVDRSGETDRAKSWAKAKAEAFTSAPSEFIERWNVDLARWTYTGTPHQLVGGRAYSLQADSASGMNRSFAIPTGGKMRAVTTFYYKSGSASVDQGIALVGVSSDDAGANPTPGGSKVRGLMFTGGGGVASFDQGVVTGLTPFPDVDTTFVVTIIADATYLSIVARSLDGSIERRTRLLRGSVPINNLYFFNSSTRTGTAGYSIGPWGARKSFAPISIRDRIEGLSETTQWTLLPNGTSVKVTLPATYDGTPAPVALCFHGNDGNENQWQDFVGLRNLTNSLLDRGMIVVAVGTGDGGSLDSTMGNDAGLLAYRTAYEYVRDNYAIGPVVFVGVSMGGQESLLTLAQDKIPGVVAWLGIVPLVSLANIYDDSRFTNVVNDAYGIVPGNAQDYVNKTAGHDPLLLDPNLFRRIPMAFLVATNDDAAIPSEQTDLMIPRISPIVPEYKRIELVGTHLVDITPAVPELTAFLDKYVHPQPVAPKTAGPSSVWDDFTVLPDGRPTVTASGNPYIFTGVKDMTVKDGLLVQVGTADFSQGAGYCWVDLAGSGEFIGCKFRFNDQIDLARKDSLCMAFFGNKPGTPTESLMHYVFGPKGMEIGFFTNGVANYIKPRIRNWSASLEPNVDYTTAVAVDHDNGYFHILMPDGSVDTIFDPRIREMLPASIANWEVGSSQNIGFKEIWAEGKGSKPLAASSSAASARSAIRAVGRSIGTYGPQENRPPSQAGHSRHLDSTTGKLLVPSLDTQKGWTDTSGNRVGNLLRVTAATATEDVLVTGDWLTGQNSAITYEQNAKLRGRPGAFKATAVANGDLTFFNGTSTKVTPGKSYVAYLRSIKGLVANRAFLVSIVFFNADGTAYVGGSPDSTSAATQVGSWQHPMVQTTPTVAPTGAGTAIISVKIAGCNANDSFLFTELGFVESTVALTQHIEA